MSIDNANRDSKGSQRRMLAKKLNANDLENWKNHGLPVFRVPYRQNANCYISFEDNLIDFLDSQKKTTTE